MIRRGASLVVLACVLGGVILGAAWGAGKAGDVDWSRITLPDPLHDPTTTMSDRPLTAATAAGSSVPSTTTPTGTTASTLPFLNPDDVVRSQAGIAGYDGDRAVSVGGDACRRMDAGVTIAGLDDPQLLGVAVGVLCPWHYDAALANGWIAASDVAQ